MFTIPASPSPPSSTPSPIRYPSYLSRSLILPLVLDLLYIKKKTHKIADDLCRSYIYHIYMAVNTVLI